jgi:hypothetical protein
MKICNHCNLPKVEEEFNWRYKTLGIRHPTCRECMSLHQKKYFSGDAHERHLKNVKERKHIVREMAKEYIYEYLSTHPCKVISIAAMGGAGYSLESIQREIEKCKVLCANCHRRLTMKERGWFRSKK